MQAGLTGGARDDDARCVVVTGGASGIGRATARRFLAEAARVVVVDRTPSSDDPAEVVSLEADVRSWDSVRAAMERAAEQMGRMDVLVCAAGVAQRGTILETDPETWDEVFSVNARGIYFSVKAAMPHLVEGRDPAVVVIASQLGLVASPSNAAYCASKGAAIQLTRAMAIDAVGDGVRINAVCPGATRTPMTMTHYGGERDLEDQHRQLIGRLLEPNEIAEAAFYLASPAASGAVGTIFVIDGGYTIH